MRKLVFIVLLLTAATVVYILISKGLPQLQKPKYSGQIEKISVANIGEYSTYNLIAQEKGYFKENGLDAQITEYESGPPAVEALFTGKADVAVAADFVGVRNIFTHKDLRVLGIASKHKVFQMIARRDRGIESPIDLRGKTIGVTKRSAGEYHLGRFLTSHNLKPEEVMLIDLTPLQMIERLENGEIDAVVIFDPHAYNLRKKLGTQLVSWSAPGFKR